MSVLPPGCRIFRLQVGLLCTCRRSLSVRTSPLRDTQAFEIASRHRRSIVCLFFGATTRKCSSGGCLPWGEGIFGTVPSGRKASHGEFGARRMSPEDSVARRRDAGQHGRRIVQEEFSEDEDVADGLEKYPVGEMPLTTEKYPVGRDGGEESCERVRLSSDNEGCHRLNSRIPTTISRATKAKTLASTASGARLRQGRLQRCLEARKTGGAPGALEIGRARRRGRRRSRRSKRWRRPASTRTSLTRLAEFSRAIDLACSAGRRQVVTSRDPSGPTSPGARGSLVSRPRCSSWGPSGLSKARHHEKGIVHTDLKPENILVTLGDDSAIRGTAKDDRLGSSCWEGHHFKGQGRRCGARRFAGGHGGDAGAFRTTFGRCVQVFSRW